MPDDPAQDLQQRDSEPDPHDVARQIVLRQLAMAPRSRHQLRDKLRQRNCPDDVAEAVLDRMTEVGLVDDEAYAAMLVRSKQAGRGLAARALAHELRTQGIDPETAEATLAEIGPDDERDRADALVAEEAQGHARARHHGPDPAPGGHAGAQGLSVEHGVRRSSARPSPTRRSTSATDRRLTRLLSPIAPGPTEPRAPVIRGG